MEEAAEVGEAWRLAVRMVTSGLLKHGQRSMRKQRCLPELL